MMKKLFTITACILACCSAKAQTIANSSLETWKSYSSMGTSLQRPDNWHTSDSLARVFLAFFDPTATFIPQVSQETTITHSGSSAAKLVTSPDTLSALLSNADFKIDLSTFEYQLIGGTATTNRTASASAWVRYIPTSTSDSASLNVFAIKDGFAVGGGDSTIGEGYLLFGNNSAYSKITANIDYNDATTVPDRIVVIFSSTDYDLPNAVLYVDDATLTSGTGIETPVFNQSDIHVYPNPATDVLQVSTGIKETVSMNIYSVTGQLVLNQDISGTGTIRIGQLPAGNYVYVLSAATGSKLYSAAFVKK